MITILTLILITLIVVDYLLFKIKGILDEINGLNLNHQSEAMTLAVQEQKSKKEPLKAIKQVIRGRSITKTEDLVDMSEVSFEDGYKALEDIGNV
jgi:hypothetical protein